MYAKPLVRPLDPATAASSCTPCPTKRPDDDVYVSLRYSQVGPFGFCAPRTVAGGPVVRSDTYVFQGEGIDSAVGRSLHNNSGGIIEYHGGG